MGGREVARQVSGTVVGTTRGAVVAALYQETLDTIAKGHKIEMHYGFRLKRFDVQKEALTFVDESNKEVSVDASHSRIIDGTGCWSKIRDALDAEDETFQVEKWSWRNHFRNLFVESADTGYDPKWHYIFSNVSGMYMSWLGGNRWAFSIGCLESQ